MEKRKPTVLCIIVLILAVLLAVGAATFAGPCVHDDGTVAACHNAGMALIGLGIAAMVVSILRLFLPRNTANGILAGIAGVLGLLAAILPGTALPLCMMETMRCQSIMHPYALVLGILIFILASIDAIVMHRSAGKPSRSSKL